jgi:hypothetical protein
LQAETDGEIGMLLDFDWARDSCFGGAAIVIAEPGGDVADPGSDELCMSEMGQISVRSVFLCLMISWLAANGISDSSPQPIAIDTPFSTSRAMAS